MNAHRRIGFEVNKLTPVEIRCALIGGGKAVTGKLRKTKSNVDRVVDGLGGVMKLSTQICRVLSVDNLVVVHARELGTFARVEANLQRAAVAFPDFRSTGRFCGWHFEEDHLMNLLTWQLRGHGIESSVQLSKS